MTVQNPPCQRMERKIEKAAEKTKLFNRHYLKQVFELVLILMCCIFKKRKVSFR